MDHRIEHEIEHGKFLSENDAGSIWNWASPAGMVRWKRRVEMLTRSIQPKDALLELGCGVGYFTREIIKTGAFVTAIDISPDLLAIARKNINYKNVSFYEENAYQMAFPNECFDSVIGSSVLHHLDIEKALDEIYRVLKPGGNIAFTEPNMMNPQVALQLISPWLRQRIGVSPDETAFYRWEIIKLLKKHGFKTVSVVPFDFLHPVVPKRLIKMVSFIGRIFERVHVVKEIAGSIYITAYK